MKGREMSPIAGKPSQQAVLAERFLARIESGEWPKGHLLPSENNLMKEEGMSRFVVRGALAILRGTGLVESRNGVGTVVIERDTILIDANTMQDLDGREQEKAQVHDALGSAVRDAGHIPSQKFRLGFIAAQEEPEVARLLEASAADTLTLREVKRSVNDQPRMIESGYFPERIASLPQLDRLRKPHDVPEGTTLYLAQNGFPDLCHEDVTETRPPLKEERDFLEVDQPVLVQWRTTFDRPGGTPIRVIRIAYRGDRYRIKHFVPGRGSSITKLTGQR
jgi:GntR family transcriptional regulator